MTESTKRVVMVATSSNVYIDEQWAQCQPAIADAVDAVMVILNNDTKLTFLNGEY